MGDQPASRPHPPTVRAGVADVDWHLVATATFLALNLGF